MNLTQRTETKKELGEEGKRRFDALAILEHEQWNEFDNKVTYEWRLSFAIWTSLVASSGAILGGKIQFEQLELLVGIAPITAAAAITVLIIVLHGWFLVWIQSSLQRIRKSLWKIRGEMEDIAHIRCQPETFTRNKFKQAPMYVQFFISILLGGIFIWVVSVAS